MVRVAEELLPSVEMIRAMKRPFKERGRLAAVQTRGAPVDADNDLKSVGGEAPEETA